MDELKIREFKEYKAYYCGLCKSIKKYYGEFARFALSNDCAFLYILAASLKETCVKEEKCPCALHPLQKRTQIITDGCDYAAAVNVLLTYHKCLDDIKDGGKKSAVYKIFINKAYNEAQNKYSEVKDSILGMEERLSECEKEKSGDTDKAAHSFAVMLGRIFEFLDENQWEPLYDLGYNLGRWIYLIDAADDLEKDKKEGNYNVFLNKFPGKDFKEIRKEAEFSLYMSLACAKEAFLKLKIYKNKDILLNILEKGLKEKTEIVLKGKDIESV